MLRTKLLRCRRTEAHNVDSTPASIAERKSRAGIDEAGAGA